MNGTGILLSSRLPLRALVAAARRAEELGYAIGWVPEETGKDAASQLSALAVSTSRIRLATGSVNCFSRTPYLMAMTAAALQEASGGRFTLVMSPGESGVLAEDHGMEYDRPISRLKDYVAIVRGLLSGETVRYKGEVSSVPQARLGFRAALPPPAIYLAGVGPRLRRLAGEVADGALFSSMTVDAMREVVQQVREGARQAGRDPEALQVACYVTAAADSRAEPLVRQALARTAALPVQNRLLHETGFATEAERIAQAASAGDQAAAAQAVSDRMLDALAVMGRQTWLKRAEAMRRVGVALPSVAPVLPGKELGRELLEAVETFQPAGRAPPRP